MQPIINHHHHFHSISENQEQVFKRSVTHWASEHFTDRDIQEVVIDKFSDLYEDIQKYGAKKTQVLDLSCFSLTSLPPPLVWKDLVLLNDLNLSDNELNSKELVKLSPLKSLYTLNVSGNSELTELPRGLVSSQQKLTSFSANECALKAFPDELSRSRQLMTLELSDNQIDVLPEHFGAQLDNLSELDLRNNQLEKLPESVKYLENLKTVILTGNPLTSIPDASFFSFSPDVNVDF